MEHRREILRPIWFADAYSNTNCNCDSYCNNNTQIYAGSAIKAYPSTASVRRIGAFEGYQRLSQSQFFTRGQSSCTLIFKSRQRKM